MTMMILFVPFARATARAREVEKLFDTYWMYIRSGSWVSLFSFALKHFTFVTHLYHFPIWTFVFKNKNKKNNNNVKTTQHINSYVHTLTSVAVTIAEIKRTRENNSSAATIYTLFYITLMNVKWKGDSFEFSLLTTSLKCDWTHSHTRRTHEHNIKRSIEQTEKGNQSYCCCLLLLMCAVCHDEN